MSQHEGDVEPKVPVNDMEPKVPVSSGDQREAVGCESGCHREPRKIELGVCTITVKTPHPMLTLSSCVLLGLQAWDRIGPLLF